MSRADLAGLVGVLILVAGIVYLAISALVLLFPKQSSGFATPADEQDATDAVNRNRPKVKRPISVN